jgi:uncharacterized protein
MAFNTFVFKVASRCNLNCTYCYVYNRGDDSWRRQPKFVEPETIAAGVRRIVDYCSDREPGHPITVGLHGGEPLLLGPKRLREVLEAIRAGFEATGVEYAVSLITNGTLFSQPIGDVLREYGIGMFISCDGPPLAVGDPRIDHKGLPVSGQLESILELLKREYSDIFGGFQTVIDPAREPEQVFDYLMRFDPPTIDFLLPLASHHTPPDAAPGTYGDWLARSFDRWLASGSGATRIRLFDKMMLHLLRLGVSTPEGLGFADAVTIEANGEFEADDTLKSTPLGTMLGLNVFEHTLQIAQQHPKVRAVQGGGATLSDQCRQCKLLSVCGGGHITHRYSDTLGFSAPSIYCEDMMRIITHVADRLRREAGRQDVGLQAQ